MRMQLKGDVTANFLNVDQSLADACGKVATTRSQQGHSNPSNRRELPSFEGYIQSISIMNARDILYIYII